MSKDKRLPKDLAKIYMHNKYKIWVKGQYLEAITIEEFIKRKQTHE